MFLNQLWNNGDCAVDSLVFDDPLELLSLWATIHNVQINDGCRYGMYFITFQILHNENMQVVAFSWLFFNFIYNEHVFQFLYTVTHPC